MNDAQQDGAPSDEGASPVSGDDLIEIVMTRNQGAFIVFAVTQQAKTMTVPEALDAMRLAISLNDLIMEAGRGSAESG